MAEIKEKMSKFFEDHKNDIATGFGLSSSAIALGLGILGTKKFINDVEKSKVKLNKEKLPKREVIKLLLKNYTLPVAFEVATFVTIILNNSSLKKKYAALAASYAIADAAISEYKKTVSEITSQKQSEELHQQIMEQAQQNAKTTNNMQLLALDDSLLTFNEDGILFKAKWNDVKALANKLNADALNAYNMSITKNEWRAALSELAGVEIPPIEGGDLIGWSISESGRGGLLHISLGCGVTDSDKIYAKIVYNNEVKTI